MVAPRAASALPPPRGGRSTPRVAGPPSPMLRHAYEPSARSPMCLSATASLPSDGASASFSGFLSRAPPTRSRCSAGALACQRCRRASRCRRRRAVRLGDRCTTWPTCRTPARGPPARCQRRARAAVWLRARARRPSACAASPRQRGPGRAGHGPPEPARAHPPTGCRPTRSRAARAPLEVHARWPDQMHPGPLGTP